MRGFRYLQNVVTLALDRQVCIGCGVCLDVCPHQIFAISGGKAVMTDRDACIECGACALNCPVKAITVEAGVGCASGMIREWLRERSSRGVEGGGSCCG